MQELDMLEHLSYVNSFVTSAKTIMGEIEWQRLTGGQPSISEQRLQVVRHDE